MDKSRDQSARPEVQARLDAMVKAGWNVGRIWGFSLGTGLADSPLGKVIADPSKILETAPGALESQSFTPWRLLWPMRWALTCITLLGSLLPYMGFLFHIWYPITDRRF